MATNVVVQGVLSFPHLFQPRAYQAGDDPKYSCSIVIIDPAFDWAAVQAADAEALANQFGAAVPPTRKSPFSQVKDGPYAGMWQITATAKADRPPELVDQQVQPIMGQNQLFAGCIVNAAINAFGYAGGSSFGLNKIQLVNSDASLPRLDGGKTAAETFEVVAGAPPALAQPAMVQPAMAQPAMAQPAMAQPAMAAGPAIAGAPPAIAQPAAGPAVAVGAPGQVAPWNT